MPVGPVAGSADLINKNQPQEVLKLLKGYEVTTAIERITANVLYYLLNNKYMDTVRVLTADQHKDPFGNVCNLTVSTTPNEGIKVGFGLPGILGFPGISASFRLP